MGLNDRLKKCCIPLNSMHNYQTIIDEIGDASIVLLGEATHGSKEFYELRADLSKQLIMQKGFNAIAIEGDWPDAYQINSYIQQKKHSNASEALASFDRFPTWMWRNVSIKHLVEWLYQYNKNLSSTPKVGFYGLDVYSLYRSIDVVIHELEKFDPAAAAEARERYACFDGFQRDPQTYAYAVYARAIASCADQVMEQLQSLIERDWQALEEGLITASTQFNIEQNARVIKNAEKYYRALFMSDEIGWNIRDSHMFETLQSLMAYYNLQGVDNPKIIVWAHNSHIGNAQATEFSKRGEYNIGQLVQEAYGKQAYALGFSTYQGEVSAASNWHAPVERKRVRPALDESYEAVFHQLGLEEFFLPLTRETPLDHELLERAIGVIYRPETERLSHYFYARIAQQFNGIIHCDTTHAVEPLEKEALWIHGESPETYPSGL